ncbi:MAG: TrmB family transcriptional regulator [Promethearchaeota archaeon]
MRIKDPVVQDRMVSQLKELELSTYEARAYLTLLTYSNTSASTLCKETGIPDSKIYFALDGLANKGMIVIQKGKPNMYQALPPKEALTNLTRQMTEKFNEKIKEAEILADTLTPIYDSIEKPEELEIAYIIRGHNNIINRMKVLIERARKEVTLFISYPTILKGLKKSLLEASEKRKVKLNIAITQKVFEEEDCSNLDGGQLLICSIDPIGMLISDKNTLLTLANWSDEVATLTQDQNLIRVIREYFDSPTCCTPAPGREEKTCDEKD